MKRKETAEAIAVRIAQLEVEEMQLVLRIKFPPPGCRHVAGWKQMQSDALCVLQKSLGEHREELASLTSQKELALD